jgi:hypothetical protein
MLKSKLFILCILVFSASVAYGYHSEMQAKRSSPKAVKPSPIQFSEQLDGDYSPIQVTLGRIGIKVVKNTEICKQNNVVGWHQANSGEIILCTDRMLETATNQSSYQDLLQSTLAHEAAHVAQNCRRYKRGIPTVGVDMDKLKTLPANVQNEIKISTRIGDTQLSPALEWRVEAEGFYYENRPSEVISLLERYCMA